MDLLNKLGQAARDAGAIANMAVEIGKLKVKILRKQEEIRREKLRIGEKMMAKFDEQQIVPGDIAEHCEKIRDCNAEIEILGNAIDAIKSQPPTSDCCCCCCGHECPECGEEYDCFANFCSNCGAKLSGDDCGCDDECEHEHKCDCGCEHEHEHEHSEKCDCGCEGHKE